METWPYIPQHGITESLEWRTDVLACRNTEQRIAIRTTPRQELILTHRLTPEQFGRARELAKTIGGDSLYLPIWTERVRIGSIEAHTVSLAIDTTHVSYSESGYAMVWQDDETFEIVEIATVADDLVTFNPWIVAAYSDAYVMPVRTATFAQELGVDRGQVDNVVASARFVAVDAEDLYAETEPGGGYTTYLTYPVLLDAPLLLGGAIREQYARELDVLDSGAGTISRLPVRSIALSASTCAWYPIDKDELWDLRIWLHKRRGRQKAFWLPSFNADVVVVKAISPGDSFIEIAAVGFATAYSLPVDVGVLTTAGGIVAIRVASVTYDGPPGTERLQFAGAFSSGLPLANIAGTCKLTLSRLDSDRIELQHQIGGGSTVAVPVVEVPT